MICNKTYSILWDTIANIQIPTALAGGFRIEGQILCIDHSRSPFHIVTEANCLVRVASVSLLMKYMHAGHAAVVWGEGRREMKLAIVNQTICFCSKHVNLPICPSFSLACLPCPVQKQRWCSSSPVCICLSVCLSVQPSVCLDQVLPAPPPHLSLLVRRQAALNGSIPTNQLPSPASLCSMDCALWASLTCRLALSDWFI